MPCAFIRLSGCNLRCSYCDSRYTWDEPGTGMTIGEVLAWLGQYPTTLVEITGGEPLLQNSVYPLMRQVVADEHTVLLETSGSLSIQEVPTEVGIILDIKCPGSGMDQHNDWSNIELLRHRQAAGSRDEIKFVLSSKDDFNWAGDIVTRHRLTETLPVLFSPVSTLLSPAKLAQLILDAQLPVRLQLQLHTQIWPDIARGV